MPSPSILVAASVLVGRASVGGLGQLLYLLGAMAMVWLLEGFCLRLQAIVPCVIGVAINRVSHSDL